MPPVRTLPAVKPMKTERTHEENQERAYIAASRRSDRSLEARIESARRASEIHKRRTGRSLRVTEQDVINEEMYEEEDDDLPMQYRRLTAHLQTQNADFDRRLAAYLTNHVAMRSALGQAVSDAYQSNNYSNVSQFMNPGMMQLPPQQTFPSPMMPPQTANRSPTSYRQKPYSMANGPSMPTEQHRRSVSVTAAPDTSFPPQQSQSARDSPVEALKPGDRHMSMPVQTITPQTPSGQQGTQQANTNSRAASIFHAGSSNSLAGHQAYSQQSPKPQPTPPGQSQGLHQSPQASILSPFQINHYMSADTNPLSTTLPMESQQLLAGGTWDKSDQWPNMMMPQASQQTPGISMQPQYSYNPNGKPKNQNSSPTFDTIPQLPNSRTSGMNQTLAPCMLDANPAYNDTTLSAGHDSAISPFMNAGYFSHFNNDQLNMDLLREPSSGQVSPGEGDWQGMLVADVWDESTAT